MERGTFFIFIILACFFVSSYVLSVPTPGHTAEEVFVYVNGKNLSLQAAIDGGEFSGNSYSGGQNINDVVFGHSAVYVKINGVDTELQSAINDGSLCLSNGSGISYSDGNATGNFGEEVLVDFGGEKSLQDAINEGLFAGEWDKDVLEYCSGQTFSRSRCGLSEIAVGTKVCCTDSSWSPATSTVCSGTSFIQTSNCENTRDAIGTKNCCIDSSWSPATSTDCLGASIVQVSNCGSVRRVSGTLCCPTSSDVYSGLCTAYSSQCCY